MSVQGDIGPRLPSRGMLYRQVTEAEVLLRNARECLITGPRLDMARAKVLTDRARAVLGSGGDGDA